MWAFDRRGVRERAERMDVKLEGVYTNSAALQAELARQLGRPVGYYEITEVDLIHGHMLVDVRLRPGQGVAVPPHEKHERNHAGDHQPAEGVPPSPHPHPYPVGPHAGSRPDGRPEGVARRDGSGGVTRHSA
jgi:hypothetical protein